MIIAPAKTFSRMFRGYDPAAVDTYIEAMTTKQQFLLNDIESLRARLQERDDEEAALRKEVAALRDTSPSPHAMQHRMAKMLRRAVDEISEMQAEARAEAEAMIAATKAEAEAEQRKHKELLADMAAKRSALEAEYEETKKKLDAELARMRAETQSEIDEAWQVAQQEREQLLGDAKQEADYYREQARRAVDEASQQRIKVLEQLMGVYRDLEAVPATLESAYQEARIRRRRASWCRWTRKSARTARRRAATYHSTSLRRTPRGGPNHGAPKAKSASFRCLKAYPARMRRCRLSRSRAQAKRASASVDPYDDLPSLPGGGALKHHSQGLLPTTHLTIPVSG